MPVVPVGERRSARRSLRKSFKEVAIKPLIPASVAWSDHLPTMQHSKDSVDVVYGLVDDPIGSANHLPDSLMVCGRVGIALKWNYAPQFRECAQGQNGIPYLGSPTLRVVSGEFARDCPDNSTKLVCRGSRPSVDHGRTLSLSSVSSESKSSSSSTVSPFSKSCRAFSMTWFKYDRFRMASISSHVLSKSAMLIITLVDRPFCVMTIGRCVRAVRAKQSLSVRRYSVKGTTSSSRRGRMIGLVFVFNLLPPVRNGNIVPYSVRCAKGVNRIKSTRRNPCSSQTSTT